MVNQPCPFRPPKINTVIQINLWSMEQSEITGTKEDSRLAQLTTSRKFPPWPPMKGPARRLSSGSSKPTSALGKKEGSSKAGSKQINRDRVTTTMSTSEAFKLLVSKPSVSLRPLPKEMISSGLVMSQCQDHSFSQRESSTFEYHYNGPY